MQQESPEVLTRRRDIASSSVPRQEHAGVFRSGEDRESGSFTAHNAEFDRRMTALRKLLARDRAAAQAELTRLSGRCDALKEFLFEADSISENLENLTSIINAEKEFASRMEQLEIRYNRSYGKYSDNALQIPVNAAGSSEPAPFSNGVTPFKSFLPLSGAIILAALIIAAAIVLVFL